MLSSSTIDENDCRRVSEPLTLFTRGKKHKVNGILSSAYNPVKRELLLATSSCLLLFGNFFDFGGELLGKLSTEDTTQIISTSYLPWLSLYSVYIFDGFNARHKLVGMDLKAIAETHIVSSELLEAFAINYTRHELITVDKKEGIKFWTLRAALSSATRSTYKGILRISNKYKKRQILYKSITTDLEGNIIFAAGKFEIHLLDAASGSILSVLSTIQKVDAIHFCPSSTYLYVVSDESRRVTVYKPSCPRSSNYSAVAHFDEAKCVAINSVSFRTICISLMVESNGSLNAFGYDGTSINIQKMLHLGAPTSETIESYCAIHYDLHLRGRSIIVVVSESGFFLVEAVLPGGLHRILHTTLIGELSKRFSIDEEEAFTLYEPGGNRVVVFERDYKGCKFLSLQRHSFSHSELHSDRNTTLVDYTIVSGALIALWFDLCVELYDLENKRPLVVNHPDISSNAACMACSELNNKVVILVGDLEGNIHNWVISQQASSYRCQRGAHMKRVRSIHFQAAVENFDPPLLISVGCDGEVKLWYLKVQLDSDGSYALENVGYFRTLSSELTSSLLAWRDYLFTGCASGAIECWKMPLQKNRKNRIATTKKPLFKRKFHESEVLSIIATESGRTSRSEQNMWLASHDRHVIVVWGFSTTFLIPFRRMELHTNLKAIYFVCTATRYVELYAYVGGCIDKLDELHFQDRDILQRIAFENPTANNNCNINVLPNISNELKHGKIVMMHENVATSAKATEVPQIGINVTLPDVASPFSYNPGISPRLEQESSLTGNKHKDRIQSRMQGRLKDSCVTGSYPTCQNELNSSILKTENKLQSTKLNDSKYSIFSRPKSRQLEQQAPLRVGIPSSYARSQSIIYNKTPVVGLRKQERCTVITSIEPFHTPAESPKSDIDGLKSTSNKTQESVSIVTLESDQSLMLDFSISSDANLNRAAPTCDNLMSGDINKSIFFFIKLEDLDEHHIDVELQASTKCRCVIDLAKKSRVKIPSTAQFQDSFEQSAVVHQYTQWYLAKARQRFLIDELKYAASDLEILQAYGSKAICVDDWFGDTTSEKGYEDLVNFAHWYAFGARKGSEKKSMQSQTKRMLERQRYLSKKLEEINCLANRSQINEYHQSMFIFEVLHNNSPYAQNISPWEKMSKTHRYSEISLALLNSDVHAAALRDQIELPDLSAVGVEGLDIFRIAKTFLTWWCGERNQHRSNFLVQEAIDAANDSSILELHKIDEHMDPFQSDVSLSTKFSKWYFSSEIARVNFVKRKIFFLKRQGRISCSAKYGKHPAPLMLETLPPAFYLPFHLKRSPGKFIKENLEQAYRDDLQRKCSTEGPCPVYFTNETKRKHPVEFILDEHEREREFMSQEDIKYGYMETEILDELIEESCKSSSENNIYRKRTDYSKSYFYSYFKAYKNRTTLGWSHGSGINNGDEVIEEQQRLEKEKNMQIKLDKQDAMRLAEEEMILELKKREREHEEYLKDMRKLRQLERKRAMVHQLELEENRRRQTEEGQLKCELEKMEVEESITLRLSNRASAEIEAMHYEDASSRFQQKYLKQQHEAQCKRGELDRFRMIQEDKRSADFYNEEKARIHYMEKQRSKLRTIYTNFPSTFATECNTCESKNHTSVLQRAVNQRMKRNNDSYAISFANSIALEDVEGHDYTARDSRKFLTLLGSPVSLLRAKTKYLRLNTPQNTRPAHPTGDVTMSNIQISSKRDAHFDGNAKKSAQPKLPQQSGAQSNTGTYQQIYPLIPEV